MEMMNGWQIFSEEEMNNENAIKVLADMIQKINSDILGWKVDSGMTKLLKCQRDACYRAINALNNITIYGGKI